MVVVSSLSGVLLRVVVGAGLLLGCSLVSLTCSNLHHSILLLAIVHATRTGLINDDDNEEMVQTMDKQYVLLRSTPEEYCLTNQQRLDVPV